MSKDNGVNVDELDESEEIDGEDLVTLVDDEGNEHEFVVLAIVDMDGSEFAMLSPLDQVEDDEQPELELFLFTYKETDEGYAEFGEIEDDATYQAVQAYCATLLDTDEDDGAPTAEA